jgi:hypothetical protein
MSYERMKKREAELKAEVARMLSAAEAPRLSLPKVSSSSQSAIAERHVRHRVQRVSDPLKPATLVVGACAGRIDSRCGDRIAQLLDEAVGALDLCRDLSVGHHGSSPSGGSPR